MKGVICVILVLLYKIRMRSHVLNVNPHINIMAKKLPQNGELQACSNRLDKFAEYFLLVSCYHHGYFHHIGNMLKHDLSNNSYKKVCVTILGSFGIPLSIFVLLPFEIVQGFILSYIGRSFYFHS